MDFDDNEEEKEEKEEKKVKDDSDDSGADTDNEVDKPLLPLSADPLPSPLHLFDVLPLPRRILTGDFALRQKKEKEVRRLLSSCLSLHLLCLQCSLLFMASSRWFARYTSHTLTLTLSLTLTLALPFFCRAS